MTLTVKSRIAPVFAFQMAINVFCPFGDPLVVDPNNPNTAYAVNCYSNPSDFATHCSPLTLAAFKVAGYDFIRLSINPAPLMEAIRNGDATRLATLLGQFRVAIASIVNAGLGVSIDMHLTGYVRDAPASVLGGVDDPAFLNYKAALVAVAAWMADNFPARWVMLEIFNEPPDPSMFAGSWPVLQRALVTAARVAAPDHTIVATSDNYADIERLLQIDPTQLGSNILYSFHGYKPALLTVQGYTTGAYNKYVFHLNGPPNPADRPAIIASMNAAVDADGSLDAAQKVAMKAAQTVQIDFYLNTPLGQAWIGQQLDIALGWATSYGLDAQCLWNGEYGITRDNALFFGALPATRAYFHRAMGIESVKRRIRRCVFAADTDDYGLTTSSGLTIGPLDPALLAAIDPWAGRTLAHTH